MNYEQAYKSEGVSERFSVGIDIKVASPVGLTEGVRLAAYQAAKLLEDAVTRDFYATDVESQEAAREEKASLLACFPESRIFVRDIPNGYCHQACCESRPWFKVTTKIGDIVIGWRKSVISIDWSESTVKATAEELFPSEDVTKIKCLIHAWGYEKAGEYLSVLFNQSRA